jgi:Tat protein translocase TatB subunit
VPQSGTSGRGPRTRSALARAARRCYRGAVFGIGPVEFIIIAVVALMLFSPKELPGIIRTFTKFWGSLRATADDFKDAIMNEEELDEIKKALKGGKDELKKAEAAARRELMKARVEMQKAQNKLIKTVKASEQVQKQEALAADGTAPAGTAPVAATPVGATAAAAEPAANPPSPASAPVEPASDPLGPEGTVARPARPEPASPKPGDGVDQGAA